MSDMTDRQAVIDALYDWSEHSMTDAEAWHLRQVIGDIKSMPSAEPEREHGKWETTEQGVFCSCCYLGWEFKTGVPAEVEKYIYCPYCGARMEEEK